MIHSQTRPIHFVQNTVDSVGFVDFQAHYFEDQQVMRLKLQKKTSKSFD